MLNKLDFKNQRNSLDTTILRSGTHGNLLPEIPRTHLIVKLHFRKFLSLEHDPLKLHRTRPWMILKLVSWNYWNVVSNVQQIALSFQLKMFRNLHLEDIRNCLVSDFDFEKSSNFQNMSSEDLWTRPSVSAEFSWDCLRSLEHRKPWNLPSEDSWNSRRCKILPLEGPLLTASPISGHLNSKVSRSCIRKIVKQGRPTSIHHKYNRLKKED